MYSEQEKPEICAKIYYYDKCYLPKTAEDVLCILEHYHFFPPSRMNADKLTRGRFRKYQPSMRDIFVQAYAEKNVRSVFWETDDKKSEENYYSCAWIFTFYKSSRLIINQPTFTPWNTLIIRATHSWLRIEENYLNFICVVKSLIAALSPFYASIDDVANSVSLLQNVHASHLVPGTIQQVYWGNYWGYDQLKQIDTVKLYRIPGLRTEKISDGVFFTLSDNLFDYDSAEVKALRNIIVPIYRKERMK